MRHLRALAFSLSGLLGAACSGPSDRPEREALKADAPSASAKVAPGDAKLLFTIGVHIEPFGSELSLLVPEEIRNNQPASRQISGQRQRAKAGGRGADKAGPAMEGRPEIGDLPPGGAPGGVGRRQSDYNDPSFFQSHEANLREFMGVIDKHDGKLVFQAQTPFSSQLVATDSALFSDAVAGGHEIALHFHEDAHLGKTCDSMERSLWTDVMKEQVKILQAAGAGEVRYWSGGNLYGDLLTAAADAGLKIMGDYKNVAAQSLDPRLLSIHPWRPAGSPQGEEIGRLHEHDADGRIVFLPEGLYDTVGSKQQAKTMGAAGNAYQLDAARQSIEMAMAQLDPGKVNVMHFIVHPGEFDWERELDPWLTEVVDPLVADGRLQWATFSEQYDAYVAWEGSQ